MSQYLLNRSRTQTIEIHSDPLCVRPSAISKLRKFKVNKLEQEEIRDLDGGPEVCPFCNPSLLDQNMSHREDDPVVLKHLDNKVISYENAAPFLAGDQRILCMWHEDRCMRYRHAHKFSIADMTTVEFYYLVLTARELARKFPESYEGQKLQKKEFFPIRCIAGFNIGKLAGQSMPHFHLQYGWDVVLPESVNPDIDKSLMSLYYAEMTRQNLILWEDERIYILAPWTPKGQYHIEIHFKDKYEITHLDDSDVRVLSYVSNYLLRSYESLGIRNMNIVYVGSPYKKEYVPFYVQFIPRSNTTALYEMIGVNVVDTSPSEIASKFEEKWKGIISEANACDVEAFYAERFIEIDD